MREHLLRSLVAVIVSGFTAYGQHSIKDINVRSRHDTVPWFYSDTTFFCKYSYIKKIDVLISADEQKIKKAREALETEDRTQLTDFRWPEDAMPGWKIDKPINKNNESFVRTYFWGDTTDLRAAFQLEVRFIKGSPVIFYLESNEMLDKSFMVFLKSYFKEMEEDKSKRSRCYKIF